MFTFFNKVNLTSEYNLILSATRTTHSKIRSTFKISLNSHRLTFVG